MFKKIAFLFLVSLFFFAKDAYAQGQEEHLEGVVTKVVQTEIEVEITKGSLVGRTIVVDSESIALALNEGSTEGEQIIITRIPDVNGEDLYFVTDIIRRDTLLYLFLGFAALVLVIGGLQGGASLVGMAFSFLVIFKVVLPMIISGQNPVLAAVFGAMLIIPVTFYLSHGLNTKTTIAVFGTLITLVFTGFLAQMVIAAASMSGLSSEEALFVRSGNLGYIDMRGLLLAGIVISSLGILDDITVSQSSIVSELKEANKKLNFNDLFLRAMRVGKDHIASLVNTLVLVYAGASLPLLLLFLDSSQELSNVINNEIIAEEIVKTLVGSISLILAVPVTTFIAAKYFAAKTT